MNLKNIMLLVPAPCLLEHPWYAQLSVLWAQSVYYLKKKVFKAIPSPLETTVMNKEIEPLFCWSSELKP